MKYIFEQDGDFIEYQNFIYTAAEKTNTLALEYNLLRPSCLALNSSGFFFSKKKI